jgi:putative flippase GtrA
VIAIAKQFGQYLTVGALGGLWHLGLLYALTTLVGLHYMASAVFAVGTTAMINFSLNRTWTFRASR